MIDAADDAEAIRNVSRRVSGNDDDGGGGDGDGGKRWTCANAACR